MRILIINQYFEPDAAASAQRLTELAEDLALEHHVLVLAGRPSYDPIVAADRERPRPRRLRVRRVLSTTLRRQHAIGRVLNYVTYLFSALALGLLCGRPHLIITATDPPLVGVVGLVISAVRRTPFVHLLWDIHPQVAIAAGLLRRGGLAAVVDRLNRRVLQSAASVVVPTEAMKESAIRAGAASDRVEVVSHWEDTAAITVQPRDNTFARQHGLVDRFVVMYSGNVGLTQSLGILLDLAHRLRDLDDVVVVVVGEGAAKRALQRDAQRRGLNTVRFIPYAPRSTMATSLATADVFLVPLLAGLTHFMLPSKLFTIMASGRPAVAAIDPASDIAELIRREGCGLVAPPGDAGAVERHVRWLHSHPAERRAMGQRGRRAAEERYARTVVTARYRELVRRFEQTAGRRPAAELPCGHR